jgi:hypothetical protein
VGTAVVTLAVEDGLGKTDTCTANVTVVDDVGPAAICQDVTVNLSSPELLAPAIDGGSSVECGPMTLRVDGAASKTFTCADVGTVSVTLEVEDGLGKTDTCTAAVTLVDDVPLGVVCSDAEVVVDEALGMAMLSADLFNVTVSDACGAMTMSVFPESIPASETGLHTVTVTVTDSTGDIGTCSPEVTVLPPLALVYTGLTDVPGGRVITVREVQDYEFSVAATGGTVGQVQFQWKHDGGSGKVFTSIPGATEAAYMVEAAGPDDAGVYVCEAWDEVNTAQSDAVTLQLAVGLAVGGVWMVAVLAILLALLGVSRLGSVQYGEGRSIRK